MTAAKCVKWNGLPRVMGVPFNERVGGTSCDGEEPDRGLGNGC
jgi:hypothetical protein